MRERGGMREIGELIMNIGHKMDQMKFMEINEFSPWGNSEAVSNLSQVNF